MGDVGNDLTEVVVAAAALHQAGATIRDMHGLDTATADITGLLAALDQLRRQV